MYSRDKSVLGKERGVLDGDEHSGGFWHFLGH